MAGKDCVLMWRSKRLPDGLGSPNQSHGEYTSALVDLGLAYSINQIAFSCCWLLNASSDGRLEHRRRPCNLVMLVDLIIITVCLLLHIGWSRIMR